jgi:ergothioneine biosynthesis protein EgtB
LGLQHEQQHQELILTDVKHLFAANPLHPAYAPGSPAPLPAGERAPAWISHPPALREIGHHGTGFAFDNESPRHPVFVAAFRLADRPVTNREWLAFMAGGGYAKPQLWLSDGWATVSAEGWRSPLYWEQRDGEWWTMTPRACAGWSRRSRSATSLLRADAYAQWAGARLPTEAEWEVASEDCPMEGNFVESGLFHPSAASGGLFGNVWEWTRSAYLPYPGYRPFPGALGEYNGKFMSNQFVLRGGSCATPRTHIRRTYRNFFPPSARWQFSGLRLARDA